MSNLLLTDRWFILPDTALHHDVQTRFMNVFNKREVLNYNIVAGRRSYKTERMLKRLFVYLSITEKKKIYYLGAPTRMQAKDLFWTDIKDLIHPIFIKNISESELKIWLKSDTILQIIGLHEFRRKQGGFADGVGVTEYQECNPSVYSHTFQPMLNDRNGFWIEEGRPHGKNHLYDNYLKGQRKENKWDSFHWTSETVLSEEQIIRAKGELSLIDYRREYLADFETGASKPYYAYSEKNHYAKQYDPRNKNLIVACDFNATIKPMSWILGFEEVIGIEEMVYWFKDFSIQFTNTKAMCEVIERWLLEKYQFLPKEMHFYGDYAGTKSTSNSSLSDWQIIEDYFRNKTITRTFLKPCLSIRDSVSSTNARLENALRQHRMFIDPINCEHLKLDWIKADWKENGVQLDESDPLRNHCNRAVDYYSDYKYPYYNIKQSKVI